MPNIESNYFVSNWLKVLFFVKIVHLSQLNRRLKQVLIFQRKLNTLYLITRLVIFMILISHYGGIGFYMVGNYVYSTNYYGPITPLITWVYSAQAYSQLAVLQDWMGQYLYVMYFSIGVTTTIAYGDITPLNPL